jgi:pyruvate/2-oxoglutarate dehydrogenase complex dihydrolipoamide dehydrogenase (E3) component
MLNCNYLVIGAGNTGLNVAYELANSGKQVILVEQAELGGTYLLSQEIPKHLLSKVAKDFSTSLRLFKDHPETFSVLRKYRQKINLIIPNQIENQKKYLTEKILTHKNIQVVSGVAEFTSKSLVEVNSFTERHLINFENAIITVGKNILSSPDIDGLEDVDFLHQHNVYLFEEIPSSLAIIGTTLKSLEVANIYANLGIKVVVFEEKDSVNALKKLDRSGFNYIIKQLLTKQVEFNFQDKIVQVKPNPDGVAIVDQFGHEFTFSHVFVEAEENFTDDNLQLNKIGINWTPKGILTTSSGQTQQRHIWALGECNSQVDFQNKSSMIYDFLEKVKTGQLESPRMGMNNPLMPLQLAGNGVEPLRTELYNIDIEYPAVTIGFSEIESASRYGKDLNIDIIESPLLEGFVKIVSKANSKQVVGVTLTGDFCKELKYFTIKSLQKNLFYIDYRNYLRSILGI